MKTDVYSVTVAWTGPEDKPFYKARLLSPSKRSLIPTPAPAFWGYAVISRGEFRGFVEALKRHRAPRSGPHDAGVPGYYVEVDDQGAISHAALGFDAETVRILEATAGALAEPNRKPVQDIVDRIRPAVAGVD